jgi:hypothetical protein
MPAPFKRPHCAWRWPSESAPGGDSDNPRPRSDPDRAQP